MHYFTQFHDPVQLAHDLDAMEREPDTAQDEIPVSPIQPGLLLTEEQQREMKAAFELAGITQSEFARQEGVGYYRLNRMVNGIEIVTPSYAQKLNKLRRRIRGHLDALAA